MDVDEFIVEYRGRNLLLSVVHLIEPPLPTEWPFFTLISSTDTDLLDTDLLRWLLVSAE